jgi:AcrR family transcriptional regulator
MRSDALRNREKLLEAAIRMFQEHGFEVPVGDIADAADVGRATLFRNFPTKEDLIAAVAVEMMNGWVEEAQAMLAAADDEDPELIFTFLEEMSGRQQASRALMEAVTDEFLERADVCACHNAIHAILDEALRRGKAAGSVRPDVVASDVIILIKGLCASMELLTPDNPDVLTRHLELIRAAISAPGYARPLRGEPAVL